MVSRPAQLPAVTTSGRAVPSVATPGSSTTASPARLPVGTSITSPRRSSARSRAVSSRRREAPALASSFSAAARSLIRARYGRRVPQVALHRRGVRGDGLGVPGDLSGHADHGAVGLVLRERLLQQVTGGGTAEPVDQVDGHVVARPERRAQRVGAPRCQARRPRAGPSPATRPRRRGPRRRSRAGRPGRSAGCTPPPSGRHGPRRCTCVSFSSTTVRAGMLMPSASVSVANTALTRPATNNSSTVSLNTGSSPAWWAAMPRSRASRQSQ